MHRRVQGGALRSDVTGRIEDRRICDGKDQTGPRDFLLPTAHIPLPQPSPKCYSFSMVAVAPKRTPPEFPAKLKTHTPLLNMQVSGLRYYNPELGRWVSRDPMREQGGLDLYTFVDNDPLNYFDSLGDKKGKRWTPPTPERILFCLAKCALTDILVLWYDEVWNKAKFCGDLARECQGRIVDGEDPLPSPEDMVDDIEKIKPKKKWVKAMDCVVKCLDPNASCSVTTKATFDKDADSAFSCNKNEQSVEYSFAIGLSLVFDCKYKEISFTLTHDLGERTLSGDCGLVAYQSCCCM